MNKSPAFQFYPSDWLSDMKVRMLPLDSRGLYMDLLCYCWREGYIPNCSSAIAQLSGCHDTAIIEPCLELFKVSSCGTKLTHERLDKERIKQEKHRKERSKSGQKGALKRWGKKNSSANGSATKQPIAKNSSSSSTSSSTSVNKTISKDISKKHKGTQSELIEYCLEINLTKDDGEYLFDHWNSNGWKNGSNKIKDWKATVRNWKRQGYLPSQKNNNGTHSKVNRQDRNTANADVDYTEKDRRIKEAVKKSCEELSEMDDVPF